MLSLHTNSAALSAQNSISKTQQSLSTSMTRLSTGYRINSAMDDAAGLQIATRLKAQTSGMAMAMRNTQNATSMIQTADGALGEANNILVRMKDLATQAADSSANSSDKVAMQSEYDALGTELTNILGNTSFGGQKLLNSAASAGDKTAATLAKTTAATAATTASATAAASLTAFGAAQTAYAGAATVANADAMNLAETQYNKDQLAATTASAKSTAAIAYETAALAAGNGGKFSTGLSFQIGASTSETMGLDVSTTLTSMQTAVKATSVNFNGFGAASGVTGTELTAGTASPMIDKLSTAIDALGSLRSALGAAGNRLDHVATNLANISTNTQAASGRIMDTDFATESSNMTASQMLLQAGTAMLKQSNSMSSMVMSLLQ
ncbi:flagellin [Janthinobacterium svalbardensis]|uniref:flagellin N-terminal helical domain-containing protein n=1 Tax=Janthinobacterium svalbardensis TaxID=368607 RepID=UPI002FCDB9AC